MLITYSNYGATSVFETYTANATIPTWTAVEGNLPDMPVRWAMFDPRNPDWALLATELGVWSTADLNGSSTDWQPTNTGLANVRVDMLQYRASDRTIAAATHGRGLFTAQLPEVLPITLLQFSGKQEGSVANLQWSTSTESNSKEFVLEKSSDGSSFYAIATIEAAGSSAERQDYSFRDNFLSASNYYRLRMVDADRNGRYSEVVLIKTNTSKQNVWVINNPFNQHIDLRFSQNAKQTRVQLISISGSVVADKQLTNQVGQYRWQLPGGIPSGTYIIRSVVDGEVFSSKAVKY
jgi:hypothetical protein